MRVLAALLCACLSGCVGHVADYFGPRSTIVTPQLIRFGLDLVQTRCVGESLGNSLTPRQLRAFAQAAGSVRAGYFDPARLGVRDLLWVAESMPDDAIRAALETANATCGIAVAVAAPPAPVTPASDVRPSAWLNLGAAASGQSIAIDAATIEQQDAVRTAWFRLTDPGAAPSDDIFRLEIDCQAQTINATERRRIDANGEVVEHRDYPDNPLPVEDGTVMRIAYLSLCT